mmetsp:Transcript_48374/g.80227  ORF Transcript_48374/g.80227 Transcript_48374/m.80227 type:complete len:558 (+) Transcript_48374:75-1748(+)
MTLAGWGMVVFIVGVPAAAITVAMGAAAAAAAATIRPSVLKVLLAAATAGIGVGVLVMISAALLGRQTGPATLMYATGTSCVCGFLAAAVFIVFAHAVLCLVSQHCLHDGSMHLWQKELVPWSQRRARMLVCSFAWVASLTLAVASVLIFKMNVHNPTLHWLVGTFSPPYAYSVENLLLLADVSGPFDKRIGETERRAEAYFREQKPLFAEAVQNFTLHPYFAATSTPINDALHERATYYEAVGKRLQSMANLLRTQGRDDFRIEKDKCAMFRFLKRNRLPIPPILGQWSDKSKFLSALFTASAFTNNTRWPVFIKFCHLTQGSACSTRAIPSLEYVRDNWAELKEFVEQKWVMRADDLTRPWRADSNTLTDVVLPGALLQGPFELTYSPVLEKQVAMELKVEVLWGRAYLARVIVDDTDALLYRRKDGRIEVELTHSYLDSILARMHLVPMGHWWNWLSENPAHVRCAWDLAERTARLIGADQIRIDIFISKRHPRDCMINENSLSSGEMYIRHGPKMVQLWREPYRHNWVRQMPSDSPPVHLQGMTSDNYSHEEL